MADDNSFVKVHNFAAYADQIKSGVVSNLTSGWNSVSFDEEIKLDCIVVATPVNMETDATAVVKNVTKSGFMVRVLVGGKDADGSTVAWYAYVAGESSNAVLDKINDAASTTFASIESIPTDRENFRKLCESTSGMDIAFVYQPIIQPIADSDDCEIDILMSDTAYNRLGNYSQLNTALKARSDFKYRVLARKYYGKDSVESVADFDDVVNNESFVSELSDASFLGELFGSSFRNEVIASAKCLYEVCKVQTASNRFNSMLSASFLKNSTQYNALKSTLDAASGMFSRTYTESHRNSFAGGGNTGTIISVQHKSCVGTEYLDEAEGYKSDYWSPSFAICASMSTESGSWVGGTWTEDGGQYYLRGKNTVPTRISTNGRRNNVMCGGGVLGGYYVSNVYVYVPK